MLKHDLSNIGKIGRDTFIGILRNNNLLVERKKSFTRTTDSNHPYYKWKNLIQGIEITHKNQVWVSDITYIRTLKGFRYLFLVTDLFSRRIMGYSLSNSLSIEGGIKALKKALKHRDRTIPLIHHSDRGIQYCCKEYVQLLQKEKIDISMTEKDHCYENACAERVNGILKAEFLLDRTFNDEQLAERAVRSAIETYNQERLHWSLELKTPDSIFFNQVA